MVEVVRVQANENGRLAESLALTKRAFASMDDIIDPPSSIHRLTLVDLIDGPGEVWAIGSPMVATVTLTPRPEVLYLGKLAVDETQRGKGLARQLVDTAERRAQELGLGWIELQTRIELVANHRTFEAMGFVETERTAHPGYDQPTSITYRRKVSPT